MDNHRKRLQYYKDQGSIFNKVLDIGAYEGEFYLMFKEFFPKADILMIEANEEKESRLKSIGPYKIALLGSEDNKEVDYFKCKDGIPTGNGIYRENTQFKFESEKKKSITLPTLLGSNNGYDLIKMDVQGSELDIIKGALPIIRKTDSLLLELQTLEYNKGAPMASDVISYLQGIGFDMVDILNLMYSENHLIQVDVLFINRNRNDS
ncbi:MAG: FkbM family methyltransferase [Caulobacteraceae bacterium]|nr:FkbM family methyltransferase [Caulobacteraceae bacterium]